LLKRIARETVRFVEWLNTKGRVTPMLELLGYVMMLILLGFVGGGFIAFNIGATEQDKAYRAMRKAQGFER
jgi:hypothetical protein